MLMFRTVEEFLQEWAMESEATLRLLHVLTDESLPQQVVENHFKLGELGWHLAHSIPVFAEQVGLEMISLGDYRSTPTEAAVIADSYKQASDSFVQAMTSAWTDESLMEVRDVFGRESANASTLRFLIQHQAHHRGQMTVLMRQAGLVVPGTYGPSREEWAAMQAQG